VREELLLINNDTKIHKFFHFVSLDIIFLLQNLSGYFGHDLVHHGLGGDVDFAHFGLGKDE
jgi:hypothetical protein